MKKPSRSREEVVLTILRAIRDGVSRTTDIIREARVSSKQWYIHRNYLVDNGLIVYTVLTEKRKHQIIDYHITSKGMTFIRAGEKS